MALTCQFNSEITSRQQAFIADAGFSILRIWGLDSLEAIQTRILSLEAKDIINAGAKGYKVSPKKKYKATLDYSLEVMKLDEVAEGLGTEIFNIIGNNCYIDALVSLSFDYAVGV